ncbi:hypothetical protein ES677_02275 [Bizionia gelidisalsuginis]|uniref:Lipocalin-like domain-containing protein n=1 Tax=Bizionia gelidisalsuginis TaxID=291188 RepID=A0ABY3MDH5_9FLAO|nr:hypothetical protein [Bizionia gelidisalsuginis]TYC17024.1 hypothetical protein ES677_02275 [Bizionia gelidisalsuginis]
MKITNLLCVFVIIFNSCGTTQKINKDKIIGSWTVSDIKKFDKDYLEITADTPLASGSEQLNKGSVLYLFPDSTFTQLVDQKVKIGQWSFQNDNEIKYSNQKLTIERFEDLETARSLFASIPREDKTVESELTLVEEVIKIKDFKKDPFYPENNQWRERPLKRESNAEIINRLSNYLLHNAYILKAAHERNENSVSFTHSKGIIKVYQGGIGIVKENRIHQVWFDYFYNEKDAMKAYHLFNSYLNNEGVYTKKSTGDWVKDDYEILLTLHSQISKTEKKDNRRFIEKKTS